MNKLAKQAQAELDAYLNSKSEIELKQSDLFIIARRDPTVINKIKQSNIRTKKQNPLTVEQKNHISKIHKGKRLEEIIGKERAKLGRESRSQQHKGKKRPKSVGEKIAATRKANGSYQSDNHGMRGKQHCESTKLQQSTKAQIRQDLKRELGLGRNDSIPKHILKQAYLKHGL